MVRGSAETLPRNRGNRVMSQSVARSPGEETGATADPRVNGN